LNLGLVSVDNVRSEGHMMKLLLPSNE